MFWDNLEAFVSNLDAKHSSFEGEGVEQQLEETTGGVQTRGGESMAIKCQNTDKWGTIVQIERDQAAHKHDTAVQGNGLDISTSFQENSQVDTSKPIMHTKDNDGTHENLYANIIDEFCARLDDMFSNDPHQKDEIEVVGNQQGTRGASSGFTLSRGCPIRHLARDVGKIQRISSAPKDEVAVEG